MHRSILRKLIIYIVPIVFIVLILSYYISLVSSQNIVKQNISHTIKATESEQATIIEEEILQIKGYTNILASGLGSSYEHLTVDLYNDLIINMMLQDPKFSSVGVWFEPYLKDKDRKTERYFVKNVNGSFSIDGDYNSENFDYLNYDLYIQSKELNKGFFSDSHYNELLNTYTITYVSPIHNPKGEFIGCVSSSFNVDKLKSIVDTYNTKFIHFYIVDNEGIYLANADLDLVTSRSNFLDRSDTFKETAQTILSSKSGTLTQTFNEKEYYVYYNTVSDFDWKLVYEVPVSYITKPLLNLKIINAILCIVAISILISTILYVSNRFVHTPLQLLLTEFKNISSNNYNSDIPSQLLKTDTEFNELGQALDEMKSNLVTYQQRLKENNEMLLSNENSLKESVDYVNSIISALPIMMFVFDRDGNCLEMLGKTPISNRPTEFYIGKNYRELAAEDPDKSVGFDEFLHLIKTIDYNDGVVVKNVSNLINGNIEYFEHSVTLCRDDVIISLSRRITDTVNLIHDMEYINEFDELTGLYNSRHFTDVLNNYVDGTSLPISIIVCDINGLKSINDKYGFNKGDQLLVDITETFNAIDVENKTVARISGDEFAIILPNTTTVEAENIIEHINTLCRSGTVSKFPFTIAYGVGTATTKKESLFLLVKSVEELLYKQKVYTSSGKRDNSIGLINSLLHAKNKREQLHSDRVSELCLAMAKALGWSRLEQNKISTAGLLHDIGKIGISEAILDKPGKLTDEEYKEMCTHPEIGYRILQSFENMKELSEYAYAHHEKWDGTGYPRRLKGEAIPLEARILAIADSYDAMTSSRAYRNGLPKEVAIAELVKCKNTQFDPTLVDIFIEKVLFEKLEDYQS